MTKEDGIKEINAHKAEIKGDFGWNTTLLAALDMAVNALEYQATAEKLWEVIEQAGYKGKEIEIRHKGRLFKIREIAQ